MAVLEDNAQVTQSLLPNDTPPSKAHPNDGVHDGTPHGIHRPHIIRCAVFFVLEAAYIVFATYLSHHPHRLPAYLAHFSPATLRSGLTTLSILWHSTAYLFASGILADSFSREWSANRKKPTDRVSTITSGVLDQMLYIFASGSTRTFKITFATSMLMYILIHLAPSTITVTSVTTTEVIAVGGLLYGNSEKSRAFLKIEQDLLGITGYETQENWIIPRPAYNVSRAGGAVEYTSDIVHFNHSCQWLAPAMNVFERSAIINGEEYNLPFIAGRFATSNGTDITPGTGIFHVTRTNWDDLNHATSSFLFFSGNSTMPLADWHPNTIDLSGLPSTYEPSWYNFSSERYGVFSAPLVTALLCDAHAELTTGKLRLANNKLTVTSFGSSIRVGNIIPRVIPRYFMLALYGINDPQEKIAVGDNSTPFPSPPPDVGTSTGASPNDVFFTPPEYIDFSPVASSLFLGRPGKGAWSNVSLPPLDLEDVARNVDAMVLTVSKAQADDQSEGGVLTMAGDGPMRLDAKRITVDPVLTTSMPYLVLIIILATVTSVASITLTALIQRQDRPPFDLKHIRGDE